MAVESRLQQQISKWLRSKGCFVMVLQPQAGIPSGTSDIVFFKEGFYGFIECKASKTSRFQPLQKEFLKKMDAWSWARAVYPSNWDETKQELEQII